MQGRNIKFLNLLSNEIYVEKYFYFYCVWVHFFYILDMKLSKAFWENLSKSVLSQVEPCLIVTHFVAEWSKHARSDSSFLLQKGMQVSI